MTTAHHSRRELLVHSLVAALGLGFGLGVRPAAAQQSEPSGENALGVDPELMQAVQVGMEQIYLRRYNAALQTFERLGVRRPESIEWAAGRAIVYQAMMGENFDESRGRQFEQEYDEFTRLYRQAERAGTYPRFWMLFIKAVLLGCNAIYVVRQGRTAAAINQGWDALELIKEAARLKPEFHDLKLALGLYAYWRISLVNKPEGGPNAVQQQAIQDMVYAKENGILARAPASLALAYTYMDHRNHEAALAEVSWIAQDYPDNILNLQFKGRVHTAMVDWDQAIQAYQRCFQVDPNQQRAKWLMGDVYYRSRRDNEVALDWFNQYLASGPPERYQVHTHYRIGQIHRRMRRWDEAIASFEQALRLDRGFRPARQLLTRTREDKLNRPT